MRNGNKKRGNVEMMSCEEPRTACLGWGLSKVRPWHDVTPLKKLVSNF